MFPIPSLAIHWLSQTQRERGGGHRGKEGGERERERDRQTERERGREREMHHD